MLRTCISKCYHWHSFLFLGMREKWIIYEKYILTRIKKNINVAGFSLQLTFNSPTNSFQYSRLSTNNSGTMGFSNKTQFYILKMGVLSCYVYAVYDCLFHHIKNYILSSILLLLSFSISDFSNFMYNFQLARYYISKRNPRKRQYKKLWVQKQSLQLEVIDVH